MAIHESAAMGFSAGADAYERGRPSYSPDAVAKLVEELRIAPGSRVLDLAAGTGKLTRQLVDTGAELVGVEPIAAMRAKLVAAVPTAEALDGTAEAIPLPNHSVDAVVVGQAFHWFDGVRAVSEIRRVLRPTGTVGMIWQARDATRPWIERLEEIINAADDGHPRFRTGAWREAFDRVALFDPIESAEFDTVQRGDAETIVDRVASISYVAAMPADRREVVLDQVRDLLATDAETAGADVIELPYRTHVYWTRPRGVPADPSIGVVVSVNVSPGGVPKIPIAGTHIRTLGLERDAHRLPPPAHGGPLQAVCLYAVEAIERIRAEGHQSFPGAYGENLTLAGIDWAGLQGGDRLRIGDGGPLLELTHFATPCRNQAQWFLEERIGRISARAYPEDARWYASVVEEGPVAPGDRVELIAGTA
ncbi:MAG TPA: methyltransferase domain-containing protein [Candidatus Limnocylindria bacterium]|nr:methyltransferase domain-containing protein [Candidatus Limnocylindria bacterium]